MTRNLRVHIDRLILDGLPAEGLDTGTLAAEVRLALEGLLAERGVNEGIAVRGAWDRIRGGAITGVDDRSVGLGPRIAQAIHAGLGDQGGERW